MNTTNPQSASIVFEGSDRQNALEHICNEVADLAHDLTSHEVTLEEVEARCYELAELVDPNDPASKSLIWISTEIELATSGLVESDDLPQSICKSLLGLSEGKYTESASARN